MNQEETVFKMGEWSNVSQKLRIHGLGDEVDVDHQNNLEELMGTLYNHTPSLDQEDKFELKKENKIKVQCYILLQGVREGQSKGQFG